MCQVEAGRRIDENIRLVNYSTKIFVFLVLTHVLWSMLSVLLNGNYRFAAYDWGGILDTYFRHPTNGYIERGATRWAWLWTLLFGPLYFVYKGLWGHAIVCFLLAIPTLWLSTVAYALIASRLVNGHYRQRGWHDVTADGRHVRDQALSGHAA